MRSRPILFFLFLLVGFAVGAGRDAAAGYAPRNPGFGDAAGTIQLFGSFNPEPGEADRWGYGAALRWRLSGRFAVGLDAARLSGGQGSISPVGAGIILSPGSSGALHPWVEIGANYVRIEEGLSVRYARASSGNPRDQFPSGFSSRSVDAWGPYFGAGVEWSATRHFGIFGGARLYSWKESTFSTAPWDGAATIRSGLSFRY
jgi:hypothetical protein